MSPLEQTAPATPARTSRPDLILGICCMSLLLVGMDITIVNVALPSIQRDLHATLSGLQWIVDAYTLVVASLLMLSGSMADRFGRRRVFQLGLLLFVGGSVLCSLAPSIGALIAFRALQGLGASMLNPVALSIITNTFTEKKARARAIGVWGSVAGASIALGPLIGGALTQTVGWRSIFWINLPIGLAAVVLTALFVPESKAVRARAIDPGGQILVFSSLASLTYAVIEGPRAGWNSPLILGLFSIAAVSVVALIVLERRLREPLLDLRFFASVPFSSATVIAVLAFSTFAACLFLNALYLQQVRHFSALTTGLCTLPLAAMMMISAPISGRMVGQYGTRPSLLIAGGGIFFGTLSLTQLTGTTPVGWLLLTYVVLGIGLGSVNVAISNSAVNGMPKAQAGVAAAIASTGRQVGASFGVAIAGTVVTTSRNAGTSFADATHSIWWLMAAAGAAIALLGWASNTRWAKASTERINYLLEDAAPDRA